MRRAMVRAMAADAEKRLAHVGAVPGRGLAGRLDRQLVEDIGDVALDGVQTQIERAGDQLVAVASRDARQHLEFARSQSFITDRGVGRGGPRRRARRPWSSPAVSRSLPTAASVAGVTADVPGDTGAAGDSDAAQEASVTCAA